MRVSRKSFEAIWRRREFGLILLIAVITLIVATVDSGFLSREVWIDILVRCAPTSIVACGVMLVVVTGEIDISVGSLMAFLAAIMGLMISRNHGNLSCGWGLPATLLLGTVVGAITGGLVTWGRVPSIIVTLGLLTALRGMTTLMMRGENIDGLPEELTHLAKHGMLGLPVGVWVAALVIVVTQVLISGTPLGRRIYAVGSSPYSANLAGLSAHRLKLFVFAYTGFLTALATVVDVPRLPKIDFGIGQELELLVVTCVVVGGVSVSGGRGNLTGVMLGVLLMTMIRPVLTFLNIGETGEKWTKAVHGLFIMLAVVSDHAFGRRSNQERAR